MNKFFRNADAHEGAGDATAKVLKAIDGLKEGQKAIEVKAVEAAKEAAQNAVKESVEPKLADLQKTVDAINEKAASITVKQQGKKSIVAEIKEGLPEVLKKAPGQRNFTVGDAESVHLALKTVGTMTVADDLLAGSSYSTYRTTLEAFPGRAVNFRSLVPVIPSATGTFQFPRERAKEGSIAYQSTPGNKKSLINARFEMITVTTDYLAGLAPVAKQMMQDLPFVQGFMPNFMLREYLFAEDSDFYTKLSQGATGSTTISGNPTSDIEQIMGYVANLRAENYVPNGIVMNPKDVYKIFINKGTTSGDYTLPPGVVLSNSGAISIFGIPVYETTFIPEDKVLVGDWSKAGIVQTDGLSIDTDDRGDNFDNNTVTWKIEARVNLAILQPAAFVFADLGNVS